MYILYISDEEFVNEIEQRKPDLWKRIVEFHDRTPEFAAAFSDRLGTAIASALLCEMDPQEAADFLELFAEICRFEARQEAGTNDRDRS